MVEAIWTFYHIFKIHLERLLLPFLPSNSLFETILIYLWWQTWDFSLFFKLYTWKSRQVFVLSSSRRFNETSKIIILLWHSIFFEESRIVFGISKVSSLSIVSAAFKKSLVRQRTNHFENSFLKRWTRNTLNS